MRTIKKTRLKIEDQNEIVNQISGTYKDFFRAAMEYIDNSIDAAAKTKSEGKKDIHRIDVEVDLVRKTVTITDDCGGMSPEELCDLLASVGKSKKKTVPWANGQFGFGVHAFRAFAKQATFVSKKDGYVEASIKIDRTIDENKDVPCNETDGKQISSFGSRVTIEKFDPHVFRKKSFITTLASEIEHHFDDVLRARNVRIFISEPGKKGVECGHFDYSKLEGPEIKKTVNVSAGSSTGKISFDLKVLDKIQDGRAPVLTNKQRRVQAIADLKSYRNFLRLHGDLYYIWQHPYVVGTVEINDFCSPNLTRDDLKPSNEREKLYETMREVQKELKELIDETTSKRSQDSFKKIGKIMSDCLSQILRKYKLEFEQLVPGGGTGMFEEEYEAAEGEVPFGGDDPGGGGEGPNQESSGGVPSDKGSSGPGDDAKGGGDGGKSVSSKVGKSGERTTTKRGPHIEFQNHAGEDRVIDLGNSLIVNTQHADFIERNPSKKGTVRFDVRLLSYISQVVAPYCVHRLFERRGKVPSVSEVGTNIVNLSLQLENVLTTTVLGEELEISE